MRSVHVNFSIIKNKDVSFRRYHQPNSTLPAPFSPKQQLIQQHICVCPSSFECPPFSTTSPTSHISFTLILSFPPTTALPRISLISLALLSSFLLLCCPFFPPSSHLVYFFFAPLTTSHIFRLTPPSLKTRLYLLLLLIPHPTPPPISAPMLHSFYKDTAPRHVRDFYLARLCRANNPEMNHYPPSYDHHPDSVDDPASRYLALPRTRPRGDDGRFVPRADDDFQVDTRDRKVCGWCRTTSTSQWRVGPPNGSVGKFCEALSVPFLLFVSLCLIETPPY